MRQLLGLNSYTKEEMDKKDDLIHEQIMDDILQSTTLLKEETGIFSLFKYINIETIHQRVKESNKTLDTTQDLQDENLQAVQHTTKQIKKVSHSICGTLFQDIKILIFVGCVLLLSIIVIFLLPKPK